MNFEQKDVYKNGSEARQEMSKDEIEAKLAGIMEKVKALDKEISALEQITGKEKIRQINERPALQAMKEYQSIDIPKTSRKIVETYEQLTISLIDTATLILKRKDDEANDMMIEMIKNLDDLMRRLSVISNSRAGFEDKCQKIANQTNESSDTHK
jgi:DNA-binding ferritin-like protein